MSDYIWDFDDDGVLPVVIVFSSCRPGTETYLGRERELIQKLSQNVNVRETLVIYRYNPEALYLQLICVDGKFSELNLVEATNRDDAIAEVRRISATPYRRFGRSHQET